MTVEALRPRISGLRIAGTADILQVKREMPTDRKKETIAVPIWQGDSYFLDMTRPFGN